MGSITDFLENELLDHVFNAAYTPAATLYLALATADPTDAATGASMNEAADANGYARTAITFGAASSRRVTQSATVTFPTASGSWGALTHWAVVDSATHGAGNVLAHGALTATKTPSSGAPYVASGEVYVEFTASNGMSDYLANALLDLAFRNQAYSAPDTYVALATATVADDDDGDTITEPSGNNYSRVQVNVNGGSSPTWDVASGGALDNTHQIDMPTPSGSWGTAVALAIVDASTSGNLLFYDNGVTDTPIGVSDDVYFGAGDLDVALT